MSLREWTQPPRETFCCQARSGLLERILGEQSTSDVGSRASPAFPSFLGIETAPLVLFLPLLLLLPHLVYAETVSGDGQIAAPIRLDEAGPSNETTTPFAEVDSLRTRARALASEGDIPGAADTLVNALYLIHREEASRLKSNPHCPAATEFGRSGR